jgi:hypothetical protein
MGITLHHLPDLMSLSSLPSFLRRFVCHSAGRLREKVQIIFSTP